jgi:two-component system chemotaxis response regulator CheB
VKVDFIGIGASTGGPPVLKMILDGLPKDFPAPVLIVQHIARGFLHGLVDWLNRGSEMRVNVAERGTIPLPGHAYLAPDDLHMTIDRNGQIALSDDAPDNGLRPSVARLFHSLAETCGPSAVGVLLSGMGKDGAVALKRMRERGAATIVQDRRTSVVYGMPGEALAIGASGCVLPADQIAAALVNLINQQPLPQGATS